MFPRFSIQVPTLPVWRKPRFRRCDPKPGLPNYITDILIEPGLHDFSKLCFDLGSFILYRLLAIISEDIGDLRIRLLLQNELDDFVVFTLQLLDCLMESFVDRLTDELLSIKSSHFSLKIKDFSTLYLC
jgi:hypothetical protein